MLHTVSTATRSGARKARPSHLVAAIAGAALALAVSTGVTHLHGTAPLHSIQRRTSPPQRHAAVVAPRGGAAETIADANTVVVPARGGYAESLGGTQPAFVLRTVDRTLALPAHGGFAESLEPTRTLAASTTVDTGATVPARGGLAESVADRTSTTYIRPTGPALALQARGGMAELIADRLAAQAAR